MRLTRRQLLSAGCSTAVVGAAGCLGGGSDGKVDQPHVFTPRLNGIFKHANWMATEYPGVMSDYTTRLNTAYSNIQALQNTALENITDDDITAVTQPLRDAKSATRTLNTYYPNHLTLSDQADTIEAELSNSLRREEYDTLASDIKKHKQVLETWKSESPDTLYPEYFIDTVAYDRYITPHKFFQASDSTFGDDGGAMRPHIFEVNYQSGFGNAKFHSLPHPIRITTPPFGVDTDGEESSPRSDSPYFNLDLPLHTRNSWLSISDARRDHLSMNIILPYLTYYDFPNEYIQETGDTDEQPAVDTPSISFHHVQAISVYIQRFESETAAGQAIDELTTRGVVDGKRTVSGMEYEKVFYTGSDTTDETLYADLVQADSYVIAFTVESQQWNNRSYYLLRDVDLSTEGENATIQEIPRNTETLPIDRHLKGTFLNAVPRDE
jgi:hypothetical protein